MKISFYNCVLVAAAIAILAEFTPFVGVPILGLVYHVKYNQSSKLLKFLVYGIVAACAGLPALVLGSIFYIVSTPFCILAESIRRMFMSYESDTTHEVMDDNVVEGTWTDVTPDGSLQMLVYK